MTSLIKSLTETKSTTRIYVVYGQPKTGKTVFAATISKYCPKILPAAQPTNLKDTLFILFDTDGLAPLRALNINPLVADLSSVTKFVEARKAFFGLLKELRGMPEIENIVIDNLTLVDLMINRDHYDEKTGVQKWGAIANDHLDFAMEMKSIPGKTFVVLFHNRYMKAVHQGADETSVAVKTKVNSVGGQAGHDYSFQMTGGSSNFYRSQANGIFAMSKNVVKGQPDVYKVLTAPIKGFEAGHRHSNAGWLPEEEPHFRKMLDKLEVAK